MKKSFFIALALVAALAGTREAAAQNRRTTATPVATSATAPANTPTPPADLSGKLDYRNPAADPLIPVEADKRKPVTDDLQAIVVELLNLFHNSRQSHWNLRGRWAAPSMGAPA